MTYALGVSRIDRFAVRIDVSTEYQEGELRYFYKAGAAICIVLPIAFAPLVQADMTAADEFIANEIAGLSSLSPIEQRREMRWFVDAAEPYAGMDITVVSANGLLDHYESTVLAPAFTAITGISVNHQTLDRSEVAEKLQIQMQSGNAAYDAFVVNADLLGTLWRYGQTRSLTDWMSSHAKELTLPTLELEDFIGTAFTTDPEGQLQLLPSRQFASLYWFRHDWFSDDKNRSDFLARYGYELDVPVNWAAYEDIAEFFTGREVDGQRVYGHLDHAEKDLYLSGQFTNTWMAAAGNGAPLNSEGSVVDAWGIRVNDQHQALGSCVSRGGSTNSPAAVYALESYKQWTDQFAPPESTNITRDAAQSLLNQDLVAQQLFWPTSSTGDMRKSSILDETSDGSPSWRMAPGPLGDYWEEGHARGYQSVEGWALLKSTPLKRAEAAWLYAQFVVSKTVDLKKSHSGFSFVRQSSINHESFTNRSSELGGLVEFYRSSQSRLWRPASINVVDYPKLSSNWWPTLVDTLTGAQSSQAALDELCAAQEKIMARLELAGVQGRNGPKLNEVQGDTHWLARPGAPKARFADFTPEPETINYDDLMANGLN